MSTNLGLPYLAAGQAQKHVTVNDSLRRLDAVVQLGVVSATTMAEPGSPADGAVYIVPSGKTGTHWASFANWELAYYRDGAWEQITPREGWLAYVKDVDQILAYTGSAWAALSTAVRVSATDKVLGRASSGAGPAEEIACTAAGRALIDDADAAAQRATLGLGSAATQNTGTSGANVPLLNSGFNFWSGLNVFGGLGLDPPGGAPQFKMRRDASTADNRIWDFIDYAGELHLRALNDAESAAASALVVTRSGASVTGVYVGAQLSPVTDNAMSSGDASHRWSVIYAATGAINTSDAREKTALRPLADAERRAAKRILAGVGVFQWREAVERKGKEAARLHVGVTAQAVAEAFVAEGLDVRRYALFCVDEVEADGSTAERLGVRHDQLFALALASLAFG